MNRSQITLKVQRLNDEAIIPTYANSGDVGMDVTATDVEYDAQKDRYIYHTGLATEFRKGASMFAFPKSRNTKGEYYIPNGVPIIDPGYRGEILIIYKHRDSLKIRLMAKATEMWIDECRKCIEDYNNLPAWKRIISKVAVPRSLYDIYSKLMIEFCDNPIDHAPYKVGDDIAQIVVTGVDEVIVKEAQKLSASARGVTAFGGSGNQKNRPK